MNHGAANDDEIEALVRFHYEGIQGTYFDELIPGDSMSLLFSSLITDTYYNYVAASRSTTLDDCLDAAEEFTARDRTLAVYAPVETDLRRQLESAGFSKWAADAWLTADLSTTLPPGDEGQITTRLVDPSDERDVSDYLAAFESAYSGADPTDPYGALDQGYLTARARSVRSGGNDTWPSLFAVASDDGAPVGVAQLVLCGDWVGVYGVGTVPEARRRGVGAILLDRLAVEARERGAQHMFLQTEVDSRVQHWYEAMGFDVAFTSPYLTR